MAPSGLYARLCHAFLVIIIKHHYANVFSQLVVNYHRNCVIELYCLDVHNTAD